MAEKVVIVSGDYAGASAEIIRRFETTTRLRATKYYEGDDACLRAGEVFTVDNVDLPQEDDIDADIKATSLYLRGLLLKRQYKSKKTLADKEVMKILNGI